ncbi:MAG TPA: DsbA family protein [Chloroflexota bacterium]|nr:DsbA family protein [Chloroflexota bacterium]
MPALTVYFDYVDPWSYVALLRLRRLVESLGDLRVNWYPFELIPDLPARGARPRNPAFLRRKTQYDVDEMLRRLDLPITIRVPYDRLTNSRLALAGALIARAHGVFDGYHGRTFEAFFERQEDIGALETVVALLHEQGVDAEAARRALVNGGYSAEVERLRAEAEEYGVAATPTFVANNQGIVGIVGDERLLRILNPAQPAPAGA